MKKVFLPLILLVAILVGMFSGGGISAYAANEKLVVYNWSDYIHPDLIGEFESYYKAKYGDTITVEYNTFETNEEVITKAMMGGLAIDLICPSEYAIEKLLRNNLLQKIDTNGMENVDNISQDILDIVGNVFGELEIEGKVYNMLDYMVPYLWGTLGILYNEDFVTEEDLEKGWGLLWNKANNPKLTKRILVKDSVRDTYVAAVLYAKEEGILPEVYDQLSVQDLINTVDNELLEIVEDVLIAQQKHLRGYEVDFGKDDMIRQMAYVNLAWSGDALYAMEEGWEKGINLNYFLPEIGSNIWFDGWVIPTSASNTRGAREFIDFLCRPESAINNMMEIGYTSAFDKNILMENEYVLSVLEENEYDIEEFFEDEIRYPVISEKLGVMKDFGIHSDAAIMMWENIKPGSTIPLLIILGILVGIIGLGIGSYVLVFKYRGRVRYTKNSKNS